MNSDDKFNEKLEMGIDAENIAYDYLIKHNSYVEDLRQQKHGEFAGPALRGTEGKVILPDFLIYNKNPDKGTFALDVKSKNSIYSINGVRSFTVDDKYLQYKKAAEIKRMDYLAMMFFFEGRMYMYKDTDCAGTHQYTPNGYGNGLVYYFPFDKSKMVY
jgi:hypothetical protein